MKILHIADISFYKAGISHALHQALSYENQSKGLCSSLLTLNRNIEVPEDLDFDCVSYDKSQPEAQVMRMKPDLAIFHSFYKLPYIRLAKILNRERIPYLIKPHGAFDRTCRKKGGFKKLAADILFFNRFLAKASGIVYLNENEKMNSYVHHIHNYYMPNGLELNNICRLEHFGEINRLNILFLGRIDVYHKGLDCLLEGLSIFFSNYPGSDIQVHIYGGSSKASYGKLIEASERKGLNPYVKFHGWVKGTEKEKAFLENDFFILTSRYEGMPMGVLEALSYGLPCLLSEKTNMADLVEKAGAGWKIPLSPEGMAAEIHAAIEEYKKDPAWWRENALSLAERFQWKDLMNGYLETYKQIELEIIDGFKKE